MWQVRLDESAGAVAAGEQLMISYGPRSNDVLLQYYGFVQPDNPHECFALEPEALILGIDASVGLPEGALQALKALPGVAETVLQAPVTFAASGADESALRLARLLTSPDLAAANECGAAPLPDSAAEAEAMRALAAVADARLEALPTTDALADGSEVGELLAAFVAEKRRVLRASADALMESAARLA